MEYISSDMLDKNVDQEDLLARVKHLSGDDEGNISNTRLNFGMKEVESNQVYNIEHSLRKGLNIGEDSSQNVFKKNVADKGYVGVQTIKEKPKKSPSKHQNRLHNSLQNNLKSTNSSDPQSLHQGEVSGPTGLSLGSLASRSGSLSTKHEINTGITLNNLASNHLPISNSNSGVSLGSGTTSKQDSRPSLSSLASNHLASESSAEKSKFTLGSLASSNTVSSDPNSKFTLGSLAKFTLTSSDTISKFTLGSLANSSPDPGSKFTLGSLANSSSASSDAKSKFTLGSLASSHLGSSNPSEKSNSSQFTIPAIFGSKLSPSIQPAGIAKERSVSPEVEIDLMSALKLNSAEQMITDEELPAEKETIRIEIIVPDISRIRSNLRKRKRSSFSKVITKKWARIQMFQPLNIYLPTNNISVFQFEEPSPDDIVIKAQSMSRAFNRQTPVRQ